MGVSSWVSKWKVALTHLLSVICLIFKTLRQLWVSFNGFCSHSICWNRFLPSSSSALIAILTTLQCVSCKCLFLIVLPRSKCENWVLCDYTLYSGPLTGKLPNAKDINSANMTLLKCVCYSQQCTFVFQLCPSVSILLFL